MPSERYKYSDCDMKDDYNNTANTKYKMKNT